ncbi:MAG: hypothetical protein J6W60_12715, partial [Treponema sp.]|nr:hypothetical protein [Treponema sp.]
KRDLPSEVYQFLSETRNGTTITYTYDGAGNLLTKSTGESYVYGDSDWKDLLTAYNGNSITYDTIGNPTVWYDGAAMTWTKGRRLSSIGSTAAHGALSFTYDAEGHRLTKTVNGVEHRYIWQGDRLISEQYGTNTLEFQYDEAGKPVGVSVNGAVFEYITNLQGDIMKVVYGGTGDVWAEYTYDAWGKVLTATGNLAAANPLRYRGYFYDEETGLYYIHHRYYDPQLCRWINADSLASTGQGFLGCNMFAYCGNDPVVTKDSSGSLSNRVDVWDGSSGSGCDPESRSILYDVPLYYQDTTNLCWAFCMVMRQSYYEGIILDEVPAHDAAIVLGERYHPILGWDTALPFFMLGKKAKYNSIEDLYLLLKDNGPLYVAYRYKNIKDGHVVLITGVDVDNGYVYTNNPWRVQGRQTESDFKRGFVNTNNELEPDYWLSGVYIPYT